MPNSFSDIFFLKTEFFKDFRIWNEFNIGSVWFFGFAFFFMFQIALAENGFNKSAIAMTAHKKMAGEGIDSFSSDPIQSNGKLKHIIIVFGARIDLADTINDFPKGMPRPKSRTETLPVASSSWMMIFLPCFMMNSSTLLSMTSLSMT